MTRVASVLIVDDDREYRDVLADVLQAEGCAVFTAENGERALEVLEKLRPDLLLVDLLMPVMSGWELCEVLESTPRLADIPLVVLSAVAGLRPVGRSRVLSKPVRLNTLMQLLDLLDTS